MAVIYTHTHEIKIFIKNCNLLNESMHVSSIFNFCPKWANCSLSFEFDCWTKITLFLIQFVGMGPSSLVQRTNLGLWGTDEDDGLGVKNDPSGEYIPIENINIHN